MDSIKIVNTPFSISKNDLIESLKVELYNKTGYTYDYIELSKSSPRTLVCYVDNEIGYLYSNRREINKTIVDDKIYFLYKAIMDLTHI